MIQAKSLVTELHRHEDIGAGRTGTVLLDKNERTVPYPDSTIAEILRAITPSDLVRYPDQSPLYEKLSAFLQLSSDNILLSSGSDSGIKILFDTFISQGDEIVFLDPTYAMINVYSHMYGCEGRHVSFGENLNLDLKKLLDSISESTQLVIIANPNQPTGTTLDTKTIEALLSKTAECEALLVIDEAYIEFADQKSLVELVEHHSNLCVLRTFSKAWGLAGVRLGFIAAPTNLVHQMRKVKPLLDINIIAIRAASYLIDNYHLVESYTKDVVHSRNLLIRKLTNNGIEALPSETNFIHIRPPVNINLDDIQNMMVIKGYRIRVINETRTILDGCLRLTVGPTQQMNHLFLDLLDVFDVTPHDYGSQ